jgi:hypothetical protein
MSEIRGTDVFTVECCGRRRGLAPGVVLVCSVCDYDHNHATVIPNEHSIKDVPKHLTVIRMTQK